MSLRDVVASFRVKIDGADKLKDVTKLLNEAKSSARALDASFGLDKFLKNIDSSKLNGAMNAFSNLAQAFAGGAIVVGIKDFVQGQVEMALGLDQTARILGVTTDELQQFHLAAELSNTSIEAVDSALRFLNRTIGSSGGSGIGAKGAKELGVLGIALKDAEGKSRPVVDVFADLADKLKATGDQGKATEIAMQVLGRGGARSLPLLMQGGEELRKKFAQLKELGGGLSPEMIKRSRDLQVEEVRLKTATEGVASEFASGFLPMLTSSAHRLTDLVAWFKKASDTTTLFGSLPIFVNAIGIAAGIYGIVKAAQALTWSLNALGYSTPLLAGLASAATALYFIFDDLFGLFTGADSEIGAVLDQMFGVGYSAELVTNVKQAWADVMSSFQGGTWKPFFDDLREGIPIAVEGLIRVAQLVKGIYQTLAGGAKIVEDLVVANGQQGADYSKLDRDLADTFELPGSKAAQDHASRDERAKNLATFRADPAGTYAGPGEGYTATPSPAPPNLPPPPAPVTVHVTNNFGPGVKDPKATADAVGHAVHAAVRKATANSNRNALGAVGGT